VAERMINDRLVWYLEKNKLITNMQSGFRKRRSTTNNLVRLETFTREAFVQKQHDSGHLFWSGKKHTTQRGNTELWRISLTLDAYQYSFRAFYRTDNPS